LKLPLGRQVRGSDPDDGFAKGELWEFNG